jgi:hypothetical protein
LATGAAARAAIFAVRSLIPFLVLGASPPHLSVGRQRMALFLPHDLRPMQKS